jgi:hypothetical protein
MRLVAIVSYLGTGVFAHMSCASFHGASCFGSRRSGSFSGFAEPRLRTTREITQRGRRMVKPLATTAKHLLYDAGRPIHASGDDQH